MGLPRLGIMLLTYNRMDCAQRTLTSLLNQLWYRGPLSVHIADDGSDPYEGQEYAEVLREIAGGYASVSGTSTTNAHRRGYGASYNLGTQVLHEHCEVILPLEDDWELHVPEGEMLDVEPLVETLTGQYGIGCIRLGYLGFTQELRSRFVQTPAGVMALLDPTSSEPHIAAGHPRLETRAWQRSVGPWTEGLPAGATEFEWCKRPAARHGVAWPMDRVRPSGDLFWHIGSESLGEVVPEGRVHESVGEV